MDRLLAQLDSKLDGEAISGAYLGWQQLPGEADEALRTDYKAVLAAIWRCGTIWIISMAALMQCVLAAVSVTMASAG